MAKRWHAIQCWFDRHDYEHDKEPINGCYWRFCKHCGNRQAKLPAWRDY